MTSWRSIITAGAAVIALAACGPAEPSPEESRRRLVDRVTQDLRADAPLDHVQARCVAEALVDTVGADSFDRVVIAAGRGEVGEEERSLRSQVVDIFAACDAVDVVLTDATTATTRVGADAAG